MDKRICCSLQTFHLKGEAIEEPLLRAVYVRFYLNKVKDKQEEQVTHAYNLNDGFMEVTK